jgi:hypothetical protein
LPAPIAVTGTANAAGAVIGEFAQGPEDVTLVTSWYDFVKTYGGYNASYPATFGVGLYFQNGGSELYVKRVLHSDAVAASATIASSTTGNLGTVTSKNKGVDGNNLRVKFTPTGNGAYYDMVVTKETVSGTSSDISNDVTLERFTNLLFNNALSSDFGPTVVNLSSKYVTLSITSGNTLAPTASVIPLTSGDDGDPADENDYSLALDDFTAVDRPLVVFAPEVIQKLTATNAGPVFDAMISWAESNNGFAIVDTDDDLSVSQATIFVGARQNSSYGAAYYPNFYISDPLGRSPQSLRKVGPAGAIAGIYIATDKQVGPFKAPAGVTATIRGAVALEKAFTSAELDSLNTATTPVNAIRNLPGAGVVVMGARTLKNDGTANKYVNMRRSLIYINKRLKDLTQFALFENNSEVLWGRIRTVLNVFLNEYRNQGGLRGATPADSFFVKCDAENNPAESIALGEVHIEVGVALEYPAEFVVINLSQKTAN